ncbi:GGDEF domain-containing protein [Cellulomonas sp. ATA003]|uniref:GGDEF domain-containing protein n=1 Tax=Cellulomonas sp. ATA003 TaxID=3073064 RepID=UPI002872E57A|nr:GGDEF domain-containing protein [Cellulomonas sp. ATA003]WNB84592.1 GGDEF domain-containing protein [Cellulomonas sp. ATA003]
MHLGEFGPFDALTDVAHALSQDGDVAEAIERCRAIEALCEAADDQRTLRFAIYIRGRSAIELGRAAEAVECAHRLLAMVDEDLRSYWRVKALALEANARAALGDNATAVDLLARATVLLGPLAGQDYHQVSASGAIAIALRRLELFEASDAQLLQMVPRLTTWDGITIVSDSLNTVAEWALALQVIGDDAGASAKYVLCASRAAWVARLVTETGRDTYRLFAATGEMFARTMLGETELALVAAPVLLANPALAHARVERLLALYALSVAQAAHGRFAEAQADLETLRELAVAEHRAIWLAIADAALMRLSVQQYGDHPAVGRASALYQRLAVSLWHERIARFDVLRSRVQVHELVAQGEEITELTRTDDLTGVGNRRALEAALADQGATAASVFVDVDHFKEINDRWSHVVGDRVLVRLARILRAQVRAGDTVVRFGGDEFLVVLDPRVSGTPDGARAAERLARRLVAAVRDEDWSRLASGLRVTVSVGAVAQVSPTAMLAAVTAALHQAKAGGRDRAVVG